MAIYTNMKHVHQSRTIKPRYAKTQATPQAVVLDPEFTAADGDIFPGSVLTRMAGGKVTLCDGTTTPSGLSGNWCAPAFGIDEVRGGAGNLDMSMWVLGGDAIFAVAAPAFDTTANWAGAKADLDAGTPAYLKANTKGLLTLEVYAEGADVVPTENTIARLIDVEGTNVILIAGLL